jgi:hypothetical protein
VRLQESHQVGPPAGMPNLSRGNHRVPTQGTCVMEYVSVLAGLPFSDHPRCTHADLATLARRINDLLSDSARAELVLRAPLLIGTSWRAGIRRSVLANLAREAVRHAPSHRRSQQILRSMPKAGHKIQKLWAWACHPLLWFVTTEDACSDIFSVFQDLQEHERDERLLVVLDLVLCDIGCRPDPYGPAPIPVKRAPHDECPPLSAAPSSRGKALQTQRQ